MISFIKKTFFTNRLIESILRKIGGDGFFRKFFPSNLHYKRPSVRYTKNDNVNFCLDISDYQEYLVYFNLKQDSSKPVIQRIPKAAKCILDIGANIGQTSLWIAEQFRESRPHIYAFEPFPDTFRKCKANLELNEFENIYLYNMALGNSQESLRMIQHSESNSGGFRSQGKNEYSGNSVEVIQTKLDHFWSDIEMKIDFIKIDVEGYELEVLKGGIKTINKYSPVMVLELNDQNLSAQNSSAKELVEFLKKKLGYNKILNIEGFGEVAEENLSNCCLDLWVSKN